MPLTMHETCVPALQRALRQLRHLLEAAQAHATERGYDPQVLLGMRLSPDMFPLLRQVQITTDLAKNGTARLAGIDPPPFPDEETTFAELVARTARALDFIDGVKAEQFEGSEARPIAIPTRSYGDLHFDGRSYLQQFVLPNVYFHLSMAYAILRHAGVPLGKADYLGKVGRD